MEIRKSSHGLYKLEYHIVWVTKYRRKILKPFVVEYLKKVLPKLLRSMPGVSLETIGFDNDHVHMMMVIPPKYSISEVMGRLKGQSAHPIRKTFAWLSKVYWKGNIVGLLDYFISSVGVDENIVRRYVEYQGKRIQIGSI